jgi:hypothetical protein
MLRACPKPKTTRVQAMIEAKQEGEHDKLSYRDGEQYTEESENEQPLL